MGNLLDMTRLEAGAMRIHAEPCDVQELIGSTLEQFGSRLEDRKVMIDLPQDLPLVPLDFVLIGRVLVNIIDNALKYSPPGFPDRNPRRCSWRKPGNLRRRPGHRHPTRRS